MALPLLHTSKINSWYHCVCCWTLLWGGLEGIWQTFFFLRASFLSISLASTYILSRISVVHHAALNCIRRIFAIIVTSMYFRSPITMMGIFGFLISCGGFLSFTHFKIQRQNQPKRLSSLLPVSAMTSAPLKWKHLFKHNERKMKCLLTINSSPINYNIDIILLVSTNWSLFSTPESKTFKIHPSRIQLRITHSMEYYAILKYFEHILMIVTS